MKKQSKKILERDNVPSLNDKEIEHLILNLGYSRGHHFKEVV